MPITSARSRLAVAFLAVILTLMVQGAAEAAFKSTCNGAVCEQVTHSGTHVSQWKATVYPGSGYNCRSAVFYVNGGVIDTGRDCGTGTLVVYADAPYTLASGSRLCASYLDEAGYACVTI